MGKHHTVKNSTFQYDKSYVGRHRIEDKPVRVIEVDVSDREDLQRLWRLERSRFGHKFFSVDSNGKYNHNWCFEDSSEYYEKHGELPDTIITMRHKDFMETYEN